MVRNDSGGLKLKNLSLLADTMHEELPCHVLLIVLMLMLTGNTD